MRRIIEILKRTRDAVSKSWKPLAWTLAAILLALILTLILRKFPSLRLPTAAIAVGVSLILLLWLFPKWQVRSVPGLEAKDRFDRENEARKTLSQILGGLILLIGFYFTWQNLQFTRDSQHETERIATEGQITDRFTKAIAQVGESGDGKLEVRLGGIYALERIAKDSPKDHWPIMEVLTAYVREHAKIKTPRKPTPKTSQENNQSRFSEPAPDVQAILTVIGRRSLVYENGEDQPLDLNETELNGARLYGDFSGAVLTGADLSRAHLLETHLRGADLSRADLRGADLRSADLFAADLSGADLGGADLRGADLRSADLSTARGLSADQLESAKGNAYTTLPPDIPGPKSWQE